MATRPAFMRATDPALRWGPLALLAFAPLAWGSVEAWSEMVVVAGSCAVGAVWLLRLALFPACCAADRKAGGQIGSWSARLHVPLLVVFGVIVLQVLPLGGVVAAVSPVGAEILRQAGLDSGSLTFSMARQETLRALAQYAAFGLLFFAVLDGVHGRAEVRRLAMAFVVLGFAHALGGILWHYQSAGSAYWAARRGSSFGPYVNRNHFACLMGMNVPLGIGFLLSIGHRRRQTAADPGSPAAALSASATPEPGPEKGPKRLLVGFAVAVMAGALGLSLSRGGLVSTLAALSVLAAAIGARRLTRGHLWMASSAVAAALAFTIWLVAQPLFDRLGTIADAKTIAARTGMWADTVRLAADFPFFGSGFGTLAEVYPRYQTVYAGLRVIHAHNDWVQLLAEGGLTGTLAVLALIGGYAAAALKRLGRRRNRETIFLGLGGLSGLLAFLLHSFTEFNAHIPANALWFTVLAALTLKAFSTRGPASGRGISKGSAGCRVAG
ncbi:MAG: O-antigen ligase family protein [Candidatus Methylomirabilia bacterium]